MYFKEEKIKRITQDLKKRIEKNELRITTIKFKEGDFKSIEEVDSSSQNWREFSLNQRWGGNDKRYWFRIEVSLPSSYVDKAVLFKLETGRENEWDAINPQFLAYLDQEIVQGLDTNHRGFIIKKEDNDQLSFIIDLHAYSGMQDHLLDLRCFVTTYDKMTNNLYYDLIVPYRALMLLNQEDKRRIDGMEILLEAANLVDLRSTSSFYMQSLQNALSFIRNNFYEKFCNPSAPYVSTLGHTHIDVAWLWTIRQTREKVARSFSTALQLMDEFPEYKFMASQPQLLKYLQEDHPLLYKRVKEKVREGSFEVEGGMWLEADCNLSSGESLVRHLLYGTQFIENEFNHQSKVLWLPDVFGYSACLPQILKGFNIDHFVTTKISWNEYNKMPYDTFNWQGLDGSEILTYFITTNEYEKVKSGDHRTIYEGDLNPSQVKGTWERYQQKAVNDDVLLSFGFGDGGGGANREMLENARRLEKGIPGTPTTRHTTLCDYLSKLEERVGKNEFLPKWVGELYLEYHRGTYTTMAKNKYYNRKAELMYQDLEFFQVLSHLLTGSPYKTDEIRKGWDIILLNQFHDIIPGTSIKEVYDQSHKQYEKILQDGQNLIKDSLSNIAENISTKSRSIICFNTLSHERNDIVYFDTKENFFLKDNDTIYEVQDLGNRKAFYAKDIPSKGFKVYEIVEGKEMSDCEDGFENQFFNIEFDSQFNIRSIYDKRACREVVALNQVVNQFQVFDDRPHNWEAWDLNLHYQLKSWNVDCLVSAEMIENGPVLKTYRIIKKYNNSFIRQNITIYNDIPRIDFDTEVDWEEENSFLKVSFPVDIKADKATYDIQFGNVERNTHWNTSWDMAKFEVCAHKWADISEKGYGVSLINDCKYGYDIKDSVMRLSLIKSPTWPYPNADKTRHHFKYCLYPHDGDFRQGNTHQQACNFNSPIYVMDTSKGQGIINDRSFVSVNSENIIIDTIKRAEHSEELILRAYDNHNERKHVKFKLMSPIERISLVDLKEHDIKDLDFDGCEFTVEFKPYQIHTFKVKLLEGNQL